MIDAGTGKVLVAMSGGVDSSVAAGLLVRAGYEVVGCFMRLGSPGETVGRLTPMDEPTCESRNPATRIGSKGCCSVGDAADARLVAAELGIGLYVCNFKKQFDRIIDYFVETYAAGGTPNPCVRCNDWLKFGSLHSYAHQIGATRIASGHHARIDRTGPSPRLRRGADEAKDQSYVLFGAPRDRLDAMLLPVGEHTKSHIRDLARTMGLPVFDKPDSQEICFVPDDDYAGLVERSRPGLAAPGRILDEHGATVGAHGGQHRFTIGQRRGVGIALGYPLYVIDKDPATNTITIGPQEHLAIASCVVGEANWHESPDRFATWTPCLAQFRAHGQPSSAMVRLLDEATEPTPSGRRGCFEIRFDESQLAVAPGQALVLYDAADPDLVLGGGWITSTTAPSRAPTRIDALAPRVAVD